MAVATGRLKLDTQGGGQIVEITTQVAKEVAASGIRRGIVTIFVTGTTAGVGIMELEPGTALDLQAGMERLAPREAKYQHNARNAGETNGHSHLQASLFGQSLVVPVDGGKAMLGTWQRIIVMDFDSRARTREIVVQTMGE
jgi:secondary thiamine-phosphate synthase enzyme